MVSPQPSTTAPPEARPRGTLVSPIHAHMLPEIMVACLPDPEMGLMVARVEEWRDNLYEALLCGYD